MKPYRTNGHLLTYLLTKESSSPAERQICRQTGEQKLNMITCLTERADMDLLHKRDETQRAAVNGDASTCCDLDF